MKGGEKKFKKKGEKLEIKKEVFIFFLKFSKSTPFFFSPK